MSTYPSEGFAIHKNESSTVAIVASPESDYELQRTSTTDSPPGFSGRLLAAVDKFWLFEFFGFILALGSLLAVVVTLREYDGRESPEWQLPVGAGKYKKTFVLNINAIISIFTTTFSSGLLIPVAASMSQLKWVWFQQGHPLSHYQAFESAARGPLGSVILLWTLRGRRLACVGAVIVVAALGVGFSIQSLVIYPLRPVQVELATIGKTNVYYGVPEPPYAMSTEMLGATLRGIVQPSDPSEMKFTCPSGNCTWEEFVTLGVCSQCFNVTDSFDQACGTTDIKYVSPGSDGNTNSTASVPYCNYTLPNGLQLGLSHDEMVMQILNSGNWHKSVHFDNNNTLGVLSSIQSFWTSSPSQWDYLNSSMIFATVPYEIMAVECGLSLCVQKYNTSVLRGSLTEKLIDTYTDIVIDPEDPDSVIFHPPSSWTNVNENVSSNVFMCSGAASGFREFFDEKFTGQRNSTYSFSFSTNSDFTTLMTGLQLDNFTDLFSSIAKSMTDNMRSSPYAELLAEEGMTWSARGASYQDRPYVQVRWAWIAFPSTLLGLSLVLLLGTIVTTAREKTLPWKGNSLAAFAHPLAGDMREKISGIRGPREMQREAEKLQVQWLKTDRGFRLVPPKQE
jgi:hypothetical protein